MSAKHTPGPWKWHPKFIIGERNGSVYAEPNEGHAYAIAMQPRHVSDGQWAADARLIASAPDLLAALKVALPGLAHKASCCSVRPSSEWEAHGSMSFDGCHCEIKVVRAAIAATTGENHEQ